MKEYQVKESRKEIEKEVIYRDELYDGSDLLDMLEIREFGEYTNKGLYLGAESENWEIVKDSCGIQVLILHKNE